MFQTTAFSIDRGDTITSSDSMARFATSTNACTAVIIGENIGLTAAHCPVSSIFFPLHTDAKFKVTHLIRHPKYVPLSRDIDPDRIDPRKLEYDIAIFKFEGDLPSGIEHAQLVDSQRTPLQYPNGIVIGAGIQIPYRQDVKFAQGMFRILGQMEYAETGSLKIIGMMKPDGKPYKICLGDSGGPLFIKDSNGNYLLAGISSHKWPIKLSRCSGQSVFTNVGYFADWIREQMEILKATN